MANRQYANGANFERRVKQRLEEQGWTVFRTAGSHSPADLIAVRMLEAVRLCSRCEAERLDGCGGGHLDRCIGTGAASREPYGPALRLVQCKGGTTTLGPKARLRFLEFAAELGAEAWIAERGLKLRRISPTGEYADEDEAA